MLFLIVVIDAPEGYQAPGFNAAAEADDHLEPTMRDTIKLGWVETPYHKLVARSYMKDSMGASHEAIVSSCTLQRTPPRVFFSNSSRSPT